MVFEGSEQSFREGWRHPWLLHLWQQPLIAVIRLSASPAQALEGSTLAIRAGIRHIEITPQVPRYLELIAQLRQDYPHCWVGVGTVLNRQMAEQAWQAGAQFYVCPFADESIIRWGREAGLPIVPGALTPGEIWRAWQAGATAVKVFPAESLGGSRYLRHLQPVLGSLPLIPTGGVTLANAAEYLQAGAWAVGIAGDLFPAELLSQQGVDPDSCRQELENRLRQTLQQLASQRVAAAWPELRGEPPE
ncbi:bifunctional 4-hydroxy-2-oxoglutarate aldolase/2-dehydro-3-deoxy-phosphogluconate aldolase [Synechococcus sp. 'PEA 65AY6A-5F PE A']|jgi:2-dehydro-3-deoxyphosphogluconate aldolase/(4S)-4-hydroxy-2-oxoglutarate aldolase|uniref:bifunctional 4-hydroxy-2-oxoglutarate aldolase/2-dehydro-3-deoxy-phosphogluconate aldolase n=1 Tax=Synechococcus sp. 'PEA 65AY6A-5F PE A' TaxID=1504259 RepID=UPI0039C0EB43